MTTIKIDGAVWRLTVAAWLLAFGGGCSDSEERRSVPSNCAQTSSCDAGAGAMPNGSGGSGGAGTGGSSAGGSQTLDASPATGGSEPDAPTSGGSAGLPDSSPPPPDGPDVEAGADGPFDASTDGSREPDAPTCSAGFGDCNGVASDGCEVSLDRHPENCGACGHDCLGSECIDGQCQPMLLAASQPTNHLAIDETNAYWSAEDGIQAVPLAGGERRTIASDAFVSGVAVAGSRLFWTTLGNAYFPQFANAGLLRSAAIEAGGAAPATHYSGVAADPVLELGGPVTTDATHLYWQMRDRTTDGAAFFSKPVSGGSATRVFPDAGYLARSDSPRMIEYEGQLFGGGGFTQSLAGRPVGGWLFRLGTSDGSYQKIWSSPDIAVVSVAAYDENVYFTAFDAPPVADAGTAADAAAPLRSSYLFRIPAQGGDAEELAARGGVGIAVDATGIYVATFDSILRVPLAGGEPQVLARTESSRALAVDDKMVYWLDAGDVLGGVWKVAK